MVLAVVVGRLAVVGGAFVVVVGSLRVVEMTFVVVGDRAGVVGVYKLVQSRLSGAGIVLL